MKKSDSVFFALTEKVRMGHKHLYKTYKENIGTFNQLRMQSKYQMNRLVDVEEDLTGSDTKNKDVGKVLAKLIAPITDFNAQIDEQLRSFQNVFDAASENLDLMLKEYKGEEGELSELLAIRRSTLYLNILVEKLKNEVLSLQLMNNALFAFYHQLSDTTEHYKKNLSMVLSFLQRLASRVKEQIIRIEAVT
jgi:hypothetical protein